MAPTDTDGKVMSMAIHEGVGLFTALIKHVDPWWIGWVAEMPGVNGQESTREQLLISLRAALNDALEINRGAALDAAGDGFIAVALSS